MRNVIHQGKDGEIPILKISSNKSVCHHFYARKLYETKVIVPFKETLNQNTSTKTALEYKEKITY